MRPDMFKVIVERERQSGYATEPKGRVREPLTDESDLPEREGIKKPYSNRKTLNENLSPLLRLLHARVGRKWDLVYAEINEHLDSRSTVKKHVIDHLFLEVETQPRFDEKGRALRPYHGRGGWYPSQLLTNSFYVDRKGFLRYQRGPSRRQRNAAMEQRRDPNVRKIDERHEYRRVNRVWWWIQYAEVGEGGAWDAIEKKRVMPSGLKHHPRLYASMKRQLGTQEIKRLKLNEEDK